MAAHHKLSLIFYLFLDYDLANPEPLPSEVFAEKSGMPRNYQIFMKGLWHMDREEFSVCQSCHIFSQFFFSFGPRGRD